MNKKIIIGCCIVYSTMQCTPQLVSALNNLAKSFNNLSHSFEINKNITLIASQILDFARRPNNDSTTDILIDESIAVLLTELKKYNVVNGSQGRAIKTEPFRKILTTYVANQRQYNTHLKDLASKELRDAIIKEVQRVKMNQKPIKNIIFSVDTHALEKSIEIVLIDEAKIAAKGGSSTAADIEISISQQLKKDKFLDNVSPKELDTFWQAHEHIIHRYLKHKNAEDIQKHLASGFAKLINASNKKVYDDKQKNIAPRLLKNNNKQVPQDNTQAPLSKAIPERSNKTVVTPTQPTINSVLLQGKNNKQSSSLPTVGKKVGPKENSDISLGWLSRLYRWLGREM